LPNRKVRQTKSDKNSKMFVKTGRYC